MNLLRKYYDKDSIGGGIPDEVRKAWDDNVTCTCADVYKSRGMAAPDCAHCNYDHIPEIIYSISTEKLKEQEQEIERLKQENERLRGEVETVIRWNESWPLRDILNELVQASEILLDKKNYDGHGWEEIRHAMNHAKVIVSHLTPSPTTKK